MNAYGFDSNGYAIIGTGSSGTGANTIGGGTTDPFGSGSLFHLPGSFDPTTFKLFEDDPSDGFIVASLKSFINFVSAKILTFIKNTFAAIFDKLGLTSLFNVLSIFVPTEPNVTLHLSIPMLHPDGIYLVDKDFVLPFFYDAFNFVKIPRSNNIAIASTVAFIFACMYLWIYYMIFKFLFFIFTLLQRIWGTIASALFQASEKNATGSVWIILFHWAHII